MRISLLLTTSIPFVFSACALKDVVVKTEYVEVLVPTKCPLKLPLKPVYDGSFESSKQISAYYLEVENIAKKCIGDEK